VATTPAAIGTVTSFDDATGLGSVRTTGGDELSFHCTAVADGTRTIEVGTAVAFEVVAGHGGRWEARGLVRTS
jgi:cold shock CspA family protein